MTAYNQILHLDCLVSDEPPTRHVVHGGYHGPMATETAILIGAALATLGWLHTGRRQRLLARKQHTINIMLQASFNKEFREALAEIAPYIKEGKCPDLFEDQNESLRKSMKMALNHYEFVAAGIRGGDIDEKLLKDSERGTIVTLSKTCEKFIYGLRSSRHRQSVYEHLEWLQARWEGPPTRGWQRIIETFRARPFEGERARR